MQRTSLRYQDQSHMLSCSGHFNPAFFLPITLPAFEVLTKVTMKRWSAECTSDKSRSFEGICCLHLQRRKISQATKHENQAGGRLTQLSLSLLLLGSALSWCIFALCSYVVRCGYCKMRRKLCLGWERHKLTIVHKFPLSIVFWVV